MTKQDKITTLFGIGLNVVVIFLSLIGALVYSA